VRRMALSVASSRSESWKCQIRLQNATKETLYDCFADKSINPQEVPLHRRAWVVQERFMSRRMLHFHKDQVFWDCHQKPACETFPTGYPRNVSSCFKLQKGSILHMWGSIVSEYSGELTRHSDKFVALAGLAQMMQAETNDDYVAGLWRRNLETQLCWFVLNGRRRVTPYCAPTWSWASIEARVNISSHFSKNRTAESIHIRVVDVQVIYATSNPFGAIVSASLRLRCDFLCPVIIDGTEIILGQAPYRNPIIWKDCSEIYDDGSEMLSTNICLLPAMSSTGLLLRPTDRKRGQYRRAGVYWIIPEKDGSAEFVSAFQSTACQADDAKFCEPYVENGVEMRRIIELV